MEYRIKEHKKDGKIEWVIQVVRRVLGIRFWVDYVKEKDFFGEWYIQDFKFGSLAAAKAQVKYFKSVDSEAVTYHY